MNPTCIIPLVTQEGDMMFYLKCDEKDKSLTILMLKKVCLKDIANSFVNSGDKGVVFHWFILILPLKYTGQIPARYRVYLQQ